MAFFRLVRDAEPALNLIATNHKPGSLNLSGRAILRPTPILVYATFTATFGSPKLTLFERVWARG
jgi:hypothetical protein